MNSRRQWVLAASAILALDVIALGLSDVTGSASGQQNPMTVSDVFSKALLGEEVYVGGVVSEVLEEYESKKGFSYQQFVISDADGSGEDESIKVFCSTEYGKADVYHGDEIAFQGKFQKYYGQYEIYGLCSDVEKT